MALLFLSPLSTLSPSSSTPSPHSMAIPTNPFSRLHRRNLNLQPGCFNGVQFHAPTVREKQTMVVQASSTVDGAVPEGEEAMEKSSEKSTSVENLPLESKQQMILEQRLKMKLAKKIRLRRKRLVRKRRLRKKGRWPPSKMKKNKNI